jgi:aminoglycoside 6'-N-acetyltransferase I
MIEIRSAQISDFEYWALMRTKLWPSSSYESHLKELKEIIGKDNFHAWLAFKGVTPIGFAEASLRPYVNGCDSSPVAFLEGIWVEEAFRRAGLGRKFVSELEFWAKSKGINEIGSDAELTNKLSHSCHSKWGFQELERVIYFRKKI